MNDRMRGFRVALDPVMELLSSQLYESPEVFLRELICNAYDASVLRAGHEHRRMKDAIIEIRTDGRRRLEVHDAGIGMTEHELEGFLACIGSSSTRHSVSTAGPLIGHFGLGFLSVLAAADEVEVLTKRPGDELASRWLWRGGTSYRIDRGLRGTPGTTVSLLLKNALCNLADPCALADLIRTHVPYLPIGIRINDGPDPRVVPAPWQDARPGRWRTRTDPPASREILHEFGFTTPSTTGVLRLLRGGGREASVTIFRHGVLITKRSSAFLPTGWSWWSGELELGDVHPTLDRGALKEDAALTRCKRELAEVLVEELTHLASKRELFESLLQFYREDVARLLDGDQALAPVRPLYHFRTTVGSLTFEQILCSLPPESARKIRYIRVDPSEDARWSSARAQRALVVWCQTETEERVLHALVRGASNCLAELLSWGVRMDTAFEAVVPGDLENWFLGVKELLGASHVSVEPAALDPPELLSVAEISADTYRKGDLESKRSSMMAIIDTLVGQVLPQRQGPTGRLLLNVTSARLRDFAAQTRDNVPLSSAILLASGVLRNGAAVSEDWARRLDQLFDNALRTPESAGAGESSSRHVVGFFAHTFSHHKKQLRALRRAFEAEPYGWEIKSAEEQTLDPILFSSVVSMIRLSDVVFADISNLNPNVLLELGLAIGLGKIVIIIAGRDSQIDLANLRGHLAFRYDPEADERRLAESLRSWAAGMELIRGLHRPEPFLGYRLLTDAGVLSISEQQQIQNHYAEPFDFLRRPTQEVAHRTTLRPERIASAQSFLRQRLERQKLL